VLKTRLIMERYWYGKLLDPGVVHDLEYVAKGSKEDGQFAIFL
jgi:hypothetical protein